MTFLFSCTTTKTRLRAGTRDFCAWRPGYAGTLRKTLGQAADGLALSAPVASTTSLAGSLTSWRHCTAMMLDRPASDAATFCGCGSDGGRGGMNGPAVYFFGTDNT